MNNDQKFLAGGIVLILIIIGGVIWYMSANPAPQPVPPGSLGGPQGEAGIITENEQYWEIEAKYPPTTPLRQSANAQADAHAVAVMKEFETNSIASFKEENGLLTLSMDDITMQRLDEGRMYALGIDYTLYTSPSTISYVYLIYSDTLGAHPNAYYRTFTFDASSGTGLILSDFFVSGSDYLGKLSEITRERIYQNLGENASEDMVDAGTTPDEDNFLNFYVEGSDFVIIFAPYQVGPWALGAQEVRIPKSEFGAIFKAEYR